MILTVNSDYFLKQHWPNYLCNGEELCFLCGTDWIFKYRWDELRLQRVNYISISKQSSNVRLVLTRGLSQPEFCVSHFSHTWHTHTRHYSIILTLSGEEHKSLRTSSCNFLRSSVIFPYLSPDFLLSILMSNTLDLFPFDWEITFHMHIKQYVKL
jgi:hypothetical protein